jgi:hypothetical protein
MSAQVRLDAVIVAPGCFLTSPDIGYSVTHHRAPGVRTSSLKERAGVKGYLACGFACVHRLQGVLN